MQQKDNGDWLSAQQAVRPDGTEVSNLPLINKKLPPLTGGLPSAPIDLTDDAENSGAGADTGASKA